MIATLLYMAATAVAVTIFFMLNRRRWIVRLNLGPEPLPDITSGLAEIAGLTGGSVHENNTAKVLQDGALVEAMLEDIRTARHSVHLETFVWSKGELEKRFVALLCQKAREGLIVRVIVDAVGARNADREQLANLRSCGVEFAVYHPIKILYIRRFNNRTHRKLLIVDGETGYTFGHGISDEWTGHGQDCHHWRDTGVRLQGPVVCSLQSIFCQDWIESSETVPSGRKCFAKTAASGNVSAHVVSSSSRAGHSSVALLYMLAIASARKEIIIQNPYFTPDPVVTDLLGKMVEKGVKVHLMLPGKYTDIPIIRRAGQWLYRPLLQAGVRVYEFEPTCLHQKIVIVDGIWSHIGSTNFDARSLALNAEIGVGLLDEGVASELREAFFLDLKRSRELTLEQWRKRPWHQQFIDWCAYQLHDQI